MTLFCAVGYNEGVENPFLGLRAALFDLDGTLIETHIDFPRMKRETLALAARFGVETAPLVPLDILGIVETVREQLVAAGEPTASRRFRAEAFALLEAIETDHCANPVEIPGAAELLARLRAEGVRVGIVTRNCRAVSERLLAAGNLLCDVLLTRDDVPRTKPDPAHLLAALDALFEGEKGRRGGSMTSPLLPFSSSATLMVGDHWMDAQAGREAGMRTVGVLRGRAPDFFAPAMPDLLVRELAELLPMLPAAG